MTRDDFINLVKTAPPDDLIRDFLAKSVVPACATAESYAAFRALVRREIGPCEEVYVMGTANWEYSLNPRKNFKPFDASSDVDIAVVSPEYFQRTWEELRKEHRANWYAFSRDAQAELRRSGENVYSGFVCPAWIPVRGNAHRYRFKAMLERLRVGLIDYKPPKMHIYRNIDELVDYCKRGVMAARR